MRVVGGRLRGRRLATPSAGPATSHIRPTSDRVREALFNILAHGIDDFALDGVHVLDLFAGTGALGIEALSRGAASCVFVENDASARAIIQDNLATLGLGGAGRLFRRDATDLGQSTQRVAFGLVMLDPPYGRQLAESALESAIGGGWLASNAIVVIEESAKHVVALPSQVNLLQTRQYGTTRVVIARCELV
ncbi:MAG: 16S rRNA (guanine(966)-N(2))-methyltransferase RsmD [Hyphomicrobiaceae bacterium]